MYQSRSQKVKKRDPSIRSYAAVKSENELYYQMASILQYIAPGKEKTAQKILQDIISKRAA